MSRPLWPFNQDSKKKKERENISLKTLINALSKFFSQGVKQKIPLTFSWRPLSLGREVTGKGSSDKPGSHEARSGSHGTRRKVAYSHLGSASLFPFPHGIKICPLQKERSSSDKICPLREVLDGEGKTMHVHIPFSMQDITQCTEQLSSCSGNSHKCRDEFEHVSLNFSLTWIYWSSSPSVVMMKKKLES